MMFSPMKVLPSSEGRIGISGSSTCVRLDSNRKTNHWKKPKSR